MAYCAPLGLAHSDFLQWDDVDRELALEWTRRQRSFCSGCGTRKEEWKADRFAYVAQAEVCPGCELMAQERKNIPEEQQGARVFLVPRAFAKDPEEG